MTTADKQNLIKKLFINRDYGLLFLGRLVSQIGDGIHYFALAWLVLDLTGSGTALGTLLMAGSLPGILLAPFTGVLADTLDRKTIIVSMDVLRGLVVLGLAVAQATDSLSLPLLYLATVVISLCSVLFSPAISASIPGLVKKEELVQANARDSLSMSATGILGPIVGALLLGSFGYTAVFLVNGCSFLLSALSETFIRFPKRVKAPLTQSPTKQFIADFKDGFVYLWANAGIRTLIIFAVFLNFLSSPLFGVVFPYFGKEVLQLSPQFYGYAQSSFPAGLLFGSLLVAYFTRLFGKRRLLCLGISAQGVLVASISILALPSIYNSISSSMILLALVPPILIMGIMNVQVNVPFQVMLQETVPDNYRGRVFGLLGSLVQMLVPVSMALYGVLIDLVPVFYFFIVCGTVSVSIGIALALSKSIRGLYREDGEKASVNQALEYAKETR